MGEAEGETASPFSFSASDSRRLESNYLVVVVRIAAVLFSHPVFFYQTNRNKLLERLYDRRTLQMQCGTNIIIAVPKAHRVAVSALTAVQIHSCLCGGQPKAQKAAVDKEESPTSDYGNSVNIRAELLIIVIISVNALDIFEPAELIHKPEEIVRKYLFSHGFRYRKNVKNLPGKPDIVLKKYNTVIFVNGCFWHGHEGCKYFVRPKSNMEFWNNKIESNIIRDKRNIEDLKKLGWHICVVWECLLKKSLAEETLKDLANEITAQLKQ